MLRPRVGDDFRFDNFLGVVETDYGGGCMRSVGSTFVSPWSSLSTVAMASGPSGSDMSRGELNLFQMQIIHVCNVYARWLAHKRDQHMVQGCSRKFAQTQTTFSPPDSTKCGFPRFFVQTSGHFRLRR